MRKRTNLVDIALTEMDFGVAEGKYFITEDGVIKTASKKTKKTIVDIRGREMVTLEKDDGTTVAVYVSDIMTSAFGTEDADNFNEMALAAAQSRTSTQRTGKRANFSLKCEETGETFKSFAEAARKTNTNYDKFYNSFYTKKLKVAKISGLTFIIQDLNTSSEETETSEEATEEVSA